MTNSSDYEATDFILLTCFDEIVTFKCYSTGSLVFKYGL